MSGERDDRRPPSLHDIYTRKREIEAAIGTSHPYKRPPPRAAFKGERPCCAYCGAKLRRASDFAERDAGRVVFGDYADDAFCGLRCGYRYGLAVIRQLRRPLRGKKT